MRRPVRSRLPSSACFLGISLDLDQRDADLTCNRTRHRDLRKQERAPRINLAAQATTRIDHDLDAAGQNGSCVRVDAARGFEATVSQLENAIEAIEDLVIVSYCDDRGILIDGNLAEQVHDDPGPL